MRKESLLRLLKILTMDNADINNNFIKSYFDGYIIE